MPKKPSVIGERLDPIFEKPAIEAITIDNDPLLDASTDGEILALRSLPDAWTERTRQASERVAEQLAAAFEKLASSPRRSSPPSRT